jgi:hypothetical protein
MKTMLRLGRAVLVAAGIVSTSGLLQTTELFAAIGDIGLNLAAVQSETEKLRQKVAAAGRIQTRIQSAASRLASAPEAAARDRRRSSPRWADVSASAAKTSVAGTSPAMSVWVVLD